MLSIIAGHSSTSARQEDLLKACVSPSSVALCLRRGPRGLLPSLPSRAPHETAGPLVYVTVAGAPGDGEQALAEALSRQLAARGVKPATAFQANVYEVQGTVRVAPAAKASRASRSSGWCSIPTALSSASRARPRIVRKGSLDKKWGAAAEAPPRQPRR